MVSEMDLRVTWEAYSGCIRPRVLSREIGLDPKCDEEPALGTGSRYGLGAARYFSSMELRRDFVVGYVISTHFDADLYSTTVSPALEIGTHSLGGRGIGIRLRCHSTG